MGILGDKIYKMMDLPKEVMLDLPFVTVMGNEKIRIENYKTILEYTEEYIRVDTKSGILLIQGKKLSIKNIKEDDILITGKIKSVDYDK